MKNPPRSPSAPPPEGRFQRTSWARAWLHGDHLTFLCRDGRALLLEGDSAELALAVLEHLTEPRSRGEVYAHVESLSGEPLAATAVVDQLLEALVASGAVRVAEDRSVPYDLAPRRVVLAVTGAVAAAHAPSLLARMLAEGWHVKLAATRNALRFVARDALEALAAQPVVASHWARHERARAHHVELAEWAELVLVYPTSASALSRLAAGSFDDVVSALALTTRAPVVLAPSMNPGMFSSPSVERNLQQVRRDGFHVVVPATGVEVAHRPGERRPVFGPAPAPDDVFAIARRVLAEHDRASSLPTDAAGWDSLYRQRPAGELPWSVEAPEADLAAALSALARPGVRALDLGTGHGTVARFLSLMGCAVVALDVSSTALSTASALDPSGAVEWRQEDVCSTTLEGPFDLVVDRGCLHCLPVARQGEWRETVRRVARPGATLLALVHDERERSSATHGWSAPALERFLREVCDEVRVAPSAMLGPRGLRRASWLCVARVAGRAGEG